jgi:hypothetical protein
MRGTLPLQQAWVDKPNRLFPSAYFQVLKFSQLESVFKLGLSS